MRKWVTLLLLLGFAWPAIAAKPMSVEQVEQLFAKLKGKPDGKVVRGLQDVQLTERVSPSRLARWEAEFPGSGTQEELLKLADISAFLPSPASDVLRDPPPDSETERHMLWTAERYAGTAMSHLPGFTATRETRQFSEPVSSPSHFDFLQARTTALLSTGAFSQTVTCRDGQVTLSDAAGKQEAGPVSVQGEFGPLLSQVLSDALEGQVQFERWEQGPSDPAAVFYYEVPERASHFEVQAANGTQAQAAHPAYRGEIEIDPETGAIFRLTEIAEMAPPHESMSAAIAVEYVPVTIGGSDYVFPAKAVVFASLAAASNACSTAAPCSQRAAGAADPGRSSAQIHLNDVTYADYRELQSGHSIVVGGGAAIR